MFPPPFSAPYPTSMEPKVPHVEDKHSPTGRVSGDPGSSPHVGTGGSAFGRQYGHVNIDNEALDTDARVGEDGRVNIEFLEKKSHQLSTLTRALSRTDYDLPVEVLAKLDRENYDHPPRLRIVIQIIGSRGDIQPFIALGKELKTYGHTVRVATHPTFRDFVKENGLEFFSVGGDPAELMS
jgi:Glycosyltransferase family 28 N-terminal domain